MAGLLNRFKKSVPKNQSVEKSTGPVKSEKKTEPEIKKTEIKPAAIKPVLAGQSQQAFRVLLKPLVTEKSTELGATGQYVFMIDPRMNKVEVKKAVRTIYGVDPIRINIIKQGGKAVSYGRVFGRRKNWKKAIVSLKPGDKIEIYEGV